MEGKKQADEEQCFKHFQKWVSEPLEDSSKEQSIIACGESQSYKKKSITRPDPSFSTVESVNKLTLHKQAHFSASLKYFKVKN